MSMTLEELEAEARKLSDAEQELLSYRLIQNLRPITGIENEELERRVREIEKGEVELKDVNEVISRLRNKSHAKT